VIYLLRHGQTTFNAEGRMQGQSESALSPLGERQAVAMGDLLKSLIPDPQGWRLVSSPLGRTRQTAAAVSAALGLPVEIDDRLIEVGVGAWQGRLTKEIGAEYPELFKSREWFFHAPGGETYDQMAERLGAWLADQPPEAERKVIAVSHGVAGRILRGLYLNLRRAEALHQPVPQDAIFRLDGGAVTRIACEPVA
jgi:broad specificity phosphatase PhoE